MKHELMTICIDDWIEFRSPGKVAVLIKQLRAVSIASKSAGVDSNHIQQKSLVVFEPTQIALLDSRFSLDSPRLAYVTRRHLVLSP